MQNQKVSLAPYVLLALSFIGISDTFFLSYYAFVHAIPSCALSGCEIVLSSVYSKFLGIPLAYFGLVFYVYMLCLAILLIIDPSSKGLRIGALLYTSIGIVLSLAFELFQYFVIGAMCMYCGISALAAALLFIAAIWHFRSSRVPVINN